MTVSVKGRRAFAAAMLAGASFMLVSAARLQPPELLDRGLVAVPTQGGGNLVQWRLRAEDGKNLRFLLFRDGRLLTRTPVTATNFHDAGGVPGSTYWVQPFGGVGTLRFDIARASAENYLTLPLDRPEGGATPDGVAYTYAAVDGSVGDVDGDGQYEIFVKWEPSNAKDNSQSGYTGNVLVDAYTLGGKRLWRIDLGRNIRAGAHYTQFMVYDFDGDRRAEIAMKTADATVDGRGRVIGDAAADFRNAAGYVLAGPEYLTMFDGRTGRALSTVNYAPGRHPDTQNPTGDQIRAVWGDNYGNRVDRFLATPANLGGKGASLVMARGYYTRSTLAAWDFVKGKLQPRWFFDSAAQTVPGDWMGQGNHQLSTGDVDGDGRDEIVYGSMTIDDNGAGLWTAKAGGVKLGHGDAMHLSDLDPARPGLERFGVHEDFRGNGGVASSMLDAATGQVLFTLPGTSDNGRGVAGDIDPRTAGAENWSSRHAGLADAQGNIVAPRKPGPTNFLLYWDGDLQRELLDNITVSKWNPATNAIDTLLTMTGTVSGNGTKATPLLSGDILGDWREEVVMAAADHQSLRIYVTPYPTQFRYHSLMADSIYRLGIAWQNVAYNQPPHLSFDLATRPQD